MIKRTLIAAGCCLLALPAFAQVHNLSKISQLAGSGNFTVPPNVYQINVNQCGGGGGGGGVGAGAAASAAGGVSGEWAVYDMAVTPGQVIAYINGAAGAAAAAGNNNGGTGGNTTFGTVVTFGGQGGTGSAAGNAVAIPHNSLRNKLHLFTPSASLRFLNSGIAGNADALTNAGGSGATPRNGVGLSGEGSANADGAAATGFCAGGAGGNNAAGTTARAGGAGTAGTIVLTY